MDMNGTIATSGKIHRLKPLFDQLRDKIDLYIVTADTFGTVEGMATKIGIKYYLLPNKKSGAQEKLEFVQKLQENGMVIAMGNGNNDALMLKKAAIGISVLGDEGLSKECLFASDFVVKTPEDALKMIITPKKLVATLRK
jgi:P-type E1-E2 ATPase